MNLDYHAMRAFADSWGLLALFVYFIAAVSFALRPRAKSIHKDAADIPFREHNQ